MNFSFLASIPKYLPYIIGGVAAVESALGTGNGATKKQLVLAAIEAGAVTGEQVPESHVAGIAALIDSAVKILNATNMLGFGKAVTGK